MPERKRVGIVHHQLTSLSHYSHALSDAGYQPIDLFEGLHGKTDEVILEEITRRLKMYQLDAIISAVRLADPRDEYDHTGIEVGRIAQHELNIPAVIISATYNQDIAQEHGLEFVDSKVTGSAERVVAILQRLLPRPRH